MDMLLPMKRRECFRRPERIGNQARTRFFARWRRRRSTRPKLAIPSKLAVAGSGTEKFVNRSWSAR